MRSTIALLGIALSIPVVFGAIYGSTAQPVSGAAVDEKGKLRVPEGYRTGYQSLGVWAVAADRAGQGSQQLHEVYVSPGAIAAYRKDGDFPDGTVLVKEVYSAETAAMTTGLVSRAGKLKGWFVMVRDAKNARQGDKLWGDGWGWSWFDANQPTKTTSTDYTTDCKGCHFPAQASYWIYVEGYPSLRH
jgi:hypothetical protein